MEPDSLRYKLFDIYFDFELSRVDNATTTHYCSFLVHFSNAVLFIEIKESTGPRCAKHRKLNEFVKRSTC